MNAVILLAGGSGFRAGTDIPKQHIIMNEHQIIEYTLYAYSSCDAVQSIMIVSNPQYREIMEHYKTLFPKLKWVINGGKTRIRSVYNSIKYLESQCQDTDYIIVSDAVRPCITHREIKNLYKELETHKAVTTAIRSYETLINISDGVIDKVIPRDGIARQTSPEAYRYETLRHLYLDTEEAIIDSYTNIGIDQLLKEGVRVSTVPSSVFNFKITTPDDLHMFELIVAKGFDNLVKQ